jgi:hypothetical protein
MKRVTSIIDLFALQTRYKQLPQVRAATIRQQGAIVRKSRFVDSIGKTKAAYDCS